MNRTSRFFAVAQREVVERIRGKAWRLSTLILALFGVGSMVIPNLIHTTSKPTKIAVVGSNSYKNDLIRTARALKVVVDVSTAPSTAQGRAQVESKKVNVAVIVGANAATTIELSQLNVTSQAVIVESMDSFMRAQRLIDQGLNQQQVMSDMSPVRITNVLISKKHQINRDLRIATIISSVILYTILGTYGFVIASGVAQEKTSRTAEVLLSTVRPGELLFGKIAGIGFLGLVQVVVGVLAAVIANKVTHYAKIPHSVWSLFPEIILWFILGYGLYSFAYALAGTLVGRQEDIQVATLPISIPMVIGYLLSFSLS